MHALKTSHPSTAAMPACSFVSIVGIAGRYKPCTSCLLFACSSRVHYTCLSLIRPAGPLLCSCCLQQNPPDTTVPLQPVSGSYLILTGVSNLNSGLLRGTLACLQVFLEPEGRSTPELYVQGFSTGLPEPLQLRLLRTLPGIHLMPDCFLLPLRCIEVHEALSPSSVFGFCGIAMIGGTEHHLAACEVL